MLLKGLCTDAARFKTVHHPISWQKQAPRILTDCLRIQGCTCRWVLTLSHVDRCLSHMTALQCNILCVQITNGVTSVSNETKLAIVTWVCCPRPLALCRWGALWGVPCQPCFSVSSMVLSEVCCTTLAAVSCVTSTPCATHPRKTPCILLVQVSARSHRAGCEKGRQYYPLKAGCPLKGDLRLLNIP